MPARPSSGNVCEDVWPSIAPAVPEDEGNGWPAATFVASLTTPVEQVDTYVRDTDAGIGWSLLFDPVRCPDEALPWLAQIAGVNLTRGLSASAQRAMIQRRPGLDRGTRAAMIEAVQATLTGTKTVGVNERTTDAYHLEIYSLTSETPNSAASLAAAMSQKPAGLILQYDVVTGHPWDGATHTWDAEPAGATWDTADSYTE